MDVEGDSNTSIETEASLKEEPSDDLTPQAIRSLEQILNKRCKKCCTIKAP